MCGITGFFSSNNDFIPKKFAEANNLIKYRGPDDFGYTTFRASGDIDVWKDENLCDYKEKGRTFGAFGFRRLSIIDTSINGHQPMRDVTNRYWIIFNGEIYNYIELKQELISKGYIFQNNTDTEVIINSYIEWGEHCLDKFNGMWAFCIYDAVKKEIFCARDRLGIKPFYYILEKNKFLFSSEIKQLIHLNGNKGYNNNLIFDFLSLGTYGNYNEETYFNNIKKLQPGHFIKLNVRNFDFKINQFWSLENIEQKVPENEDNVYDEIKQLLLDSTKIRLRSDVPIGTALSGGLDSSGLVCLIDSIYNHSKIKNKVFTVFSNDDNIKDPYYARLITDNIPVTSYSTNFTNNSNINDLSKFIWHQEEPLQSASIFGSWYLYHFIKENNVTVAIDGQGADELMGGYYRFPYKTFFIDLLKHRYFKNYFNQAEMLTDLYGVKKTKFQISILKGLFVDFLKKNSTSYYSAKLGNVKKYLDKDFYNQHFKTSNLISGNYLKNSMVFKSGMKNDSYKLASFTNLPGILRQVDRNSMAASVEARVPFLDYRLVEFLFSLPFTYMFKNGYTKYAYRKSMEGVIPDKVLWRKDKEGFKMPEYEILNNNKDYVLSIFDKNKHDSFLNISLLKEQYLGSINNKLKYNNITWRSINYLIWKDLYYS